MNESQPPQPPSQRTPGTTVRVAVGLGSNLGDREANLRHGLAALAASGAARWTAVSSVYETDPVGPVADQPPFLNQVAVGETELSPGALLYMCFAVEKQRGRERGVHAPRWGPRTLDLDLLIYGDAVLDLPGLRIPHPEMTRRAFVLLPLAAIAPDWRVPGGDDGGGATAKELARTVAGRETVRLWRSSAT